MAYSSWVSDLKTRSSVGFLGKVVNLLVQAKDRVDTNHTNITANNNSTVKGGLALTYQLTGKGSSPTALDGSAITVMQTDGDSAANGALTIANGTYDGQHMRVFYQTQNAAKKISIDFTAGGLISLNDAMKRYIRFSDQAEWCELLWNSANTRWMVGTYSGIEILDSI